MDRPRPVVHRRLAAAAMGILVGVAVLEIGLRAAGAIFVASSAQRFALDPNDRRPLVAFAGDSNIYGLYVEDHQTLPKALEAITKESGGGVRTVNLGVPASPSWVVLGQVRRALELHPSAVVVTCGINNYSSVPPGEGLGVLEKLYFVKALRRAVLNWEVRNAREIPLPSGVGAAPLEGAAITNEEQRAIIKMKPRDGGETPFDIQRLHRALPWESTGPRLEADLVEFGRLCRDAGAKPVLATYLAGSTVGFAAITDLMRALAAREGIALADCAKILEAAVDSAMRPGGWGGDSPSPFAPENARALLLTTDQHPTPLGFRAEARVVAAALRNVGIAEAAAPEDPLSVLPPSQSVVPRLRRMSAAKELAFRYLGDPKDRVTLFVGRPGESWFEGNPLPVDRNLGDGRGGGPIAPVAATADGKGAAQLTVPAVDAARLRGELRAIVLVRRGGAAGASQLFYGDVISFEAPESRAGR